MVVLQRKGKKKPSTEVWALRNCVFPPSWSLACWAYRGEQMWTCWTLGRLFRPFQATHTHTNTLVEVSESWLWSSGLGQVFIFQPPKALKPCSYVSPLSPFLLSTPVCPPIIFIIQLLSRIHLPSIIHLFSHKSFSQLLSLNFPSDLHPSFSHLSPPYPPEGFFFFYFFRFSPLNLPPISLWRSAVQWLEQQNVRSSYINI